MEILGLNGVNTDNTRIRGTENGSGAQKEAVSFQNPPDFFDKVDSGTETKRKAEMSTGSLGYVYTQMQMTGESFAHIMHNGVPVTCRVENQKDGSVKCKTTIGAETSGTQWYSVVTRDGIVKFDLNDMGSVLQCLDMFSPEDANKILQVVQMQKVANGIEKEINDILNGVTNEIQDKIEQNTETDTDDSSSSYEGITDPPSEQQMQQLFADRNITGTTEAGMDKSGLL